MSIISEPSMSDCPCGDREKKCKRCGLCFPETTEHFMRHKNGKNGLHPWCRTCYAAYQRAHYADNQEARTAQKREYHEDHREERLEYGRRYTKEHHDEILEYMRRYNAEHKEERAASSRAYYAEHREEHIERVKQYNLKHPQKRREQHRIYIHKRRAKKKGSGGQYRKSDLARLYETQNGCCCWCGKEMVNRLLYKKMPPELYSKMFTVDHISAIETGGTSWGWNIVLACWSCNCSRKHKYVFSEWQPPAMLEHMQGYIVRSVILELLWKLWR